MTKTPEKIPLGWPLAILLCAGASVLSATSAQERTPAADYVELTVAVADRQLNALPGLTAGQIRVFEDDVEQSIVSVRPLADAPLALAFVLDASNSMGSDVQTGARLAVECSSRMRENDQAAVIAFNSRVSTLQDFTSNAELIARSVSAIRRRGSTSLHGALIVILRELEKQSLRSDSLPRLAVLVVSDGIDTSSLARFDQVLDVARRSSAIIYGVGQNGTPERRNRSVLPPLARETGGEYLIPTRSPDPAAICDSILNDLRGQYAVRYTPSVPIGDGKWRKLSVGIDVPGAQVRTRSGYFASTSSSPRAGKPGAVPRAR